MVRQLLETDQKALEINLDSDIYGSFAEIGAGQEVARHFFKVGAAAGTIAKTISAYDKVVSDEVYGTEISGRYVCESRLYRMLDHEYELMLDRLADERPNTCLFAFADTISAMNYHKTNKGHGWLALRFQLEPQGEPNDLILHVEMLDNNTSLQQQAIGILGVNIVYACYRYHHDYRQLLGSLLDNIRDRVQVDMCRLSGAQFKDLDNRLLTLELVKQDLTKVAIFDKRGKPVHPSEFLYKHNLLVVRGSYRPATLVNLDMLQTATSQFKKEPEVESRRTHITTEITLANLMKDTGKVEEQDYLDRADLLNHLGQTVMVSNCDYRELVKYIMAYRVAKLGIVLGARQLLDLLHNKYYENQDGRLLGAFGDLFTKDVRMYVYPAQKEGSGELMKSSNLPIPEKMQFLYRHILDSKHIVDVEGADQKILHVYSAEVLRKLKADETGWDKLVSTKVAEYIRDRKLFGFPCQTIEFDY